MIRFYYIDVDLKNGSDSPEKVFSSEYSARKHYDSIKLNDSVVYKCLKAYDDKAGTVLIAAEG